MSRVDRSTHWNGIYASKRSDELGWFQDADFGAMVVRATSSRMDPCVSAIQRQ
jgi:hypothetical protein